MPLWNRDLTRPRNIQGSGVNTTDGTYTTTGAVLCWFQATLDPSRRYRLQSTHAFTTDSGSLATSNPYNDVLFLFLHGLAGGAAITTTSPELTSDTVTTDAISNANLGTYDATDDTPYRFMSLSYLLPAGWSGLYSFGASIKVVTQPSGSAGDTFYGKSGFKFQLALDDIGQA